MLIRIILEALFSNELDMFEANTFRDINFLLWEHELLFTRFFIMIRKTYMKPGVQAYFGLLLGFYRRIKIFYQIKRMLNCID